MAFKIFRWHAKTAPVKKESATQVTRSKLRSLSSLVNPRRLVGDRLKKKTATRIHGGVFSTTIPREKGSRSLLQQQDNSYAPQWKASQTKGYHKHAPLIVPQTRRGSDCSSTTHSSESSLNWDPSAALGAMMARSRQLPQTTTFASNHIMINMQRQRYTVSPLVRMSDLDNLAREYAQEMATSGKLQRKDTVDLQAKLSRPSRRLGMNVAVGKSIHQIHMAMKDSIGDMNNMIDRRYTQMGMGTARTSTGDLYLCQIYRG